MKVYIEMGKDGDGAQEVYSVSATRLSDYAEEWDVENMLIDKQDGEVLFTNVFGEEFRAGDWFTYVFSIGSYYEFNVYKLERMTSDGKQAIGRKTRTTYHTKVLKFLENPDRIVNLNQVRKLTKEMVINYIDWLSEPTEESKNTIKAEIDKRN